MTNNMTEVASYETSFTIKMSLPLSSMCESYVKKVPIDFSLTST